jgi:hypothetical protein
MKFALPMNTATTQMSMILMRAVQEKLSKELKTEAQTMADLPYTAKLGENEIVPLISY